MTRYGLWLARRAWFVLGAWVVAIIASFGVTLGGFGDGLFAHLQQQEPYVASESHDGNEKLISGPRSGGTVLIRVDFHSASGPVKDQKNAALGRQLHTKIASDPSVQKVESPYSSGATSNPRSAAPFLSTSQPSAAMISVVLQPGTEKKAQEAAAERLTRLATSTVGSRAKVTVGGSVTVLERITDQVEKDLRTGEGIAFPLTLLVMIVVFGGFVAAGLPLLGAVAAIAGGLLSLYGFAQVTDLDATTVNIVTILGLGLSIDYGLLIVSRFREELARTVHTVADSGSDDLANTSQAAQHLPSEQLDVVTATTVATAGRTILFSGLTVAISVSGLVLLPASVTRSIGLAGLSVVLMACLAALTLVPAAARLAARRLARGAVTTDPEEGRFARLARAVQRHVWVSICAVAALLLLLASPVLGMRQVSSTGALLPTSDNQRVFLQDLRHDFPLLAEPDVTVVAKTTPERASEWATNVWADRPEVKQVTQARPLDDGYVAVGALVKDAHVTSPDAKNLVTYLRNNRPDFPIMVTGQQAKLLDFSDAIRSHAPLVVVVVSIATIVLLFLMTGSIVLPLKALLFNAISLAASLGALTWIFQNGHFEGLLGYTSNDALESVIPVILLAFGFGLAMDYEVFLLARVVEAHRQGEPDERAVAHGLQRSGRIITSAALLMVIVMLGFAAAKMIAVKQIGVGLALSIILDATLVRMILVPATMTIMGRWNWWAPGPLRRVHERLGLEHKSPQPRRRSAR